MDRGAIALAVYRPRADLLRVQVESLQAQELGEWTCHVGIDGDDPQALALVRELTAGDARFVIHAYADRVGHYRNFERVVAQASQRAAWVALADQDDRWDPDKLAVLVEVLTSRQAMAVMSQARIVDDRGVPRGQTDRQVTPLASLLLDNQVTGSLTVFAPSVVQRALPFPEPTDAAYHDHWLGMVAASLGAIVLVDRPLQAYVQHGANVLGEQSHGRWRARVKGLTAGGAAGAVDVLVRHRWEWRRRMAGELIARLPESPDPMLRDVAAGRITGAVAWAMLTAVSRRHASASRVSALLLGSVIAQAVTARRSGEAG